MYRDTPNRYESHRKKLVFSTLCHKPQKRRGRYSDAFLLLYQRAVNLNTTYLQTGIRKFNPRKVSRGSKLHNHPENQQYRPTQYILSNTNYYRLLIFCRAIASGVPSRWGPPLLVGWGAAFRRLFAPRLIRAPGGVFGSWALCGSVPSWVLCFLWLRPVPRRPCAFALSFC